MLSLLKVYMGGIFSVLLLISAPFLLPWNAEGLQPQIFTISWLLIAILTTFSFIKAIAKREQLMFIRRKWRGKQKSSRVYKQQREKVVNHQQGHSAGKK